MAYPKVKGSIILKVLVVVAAAALIASVFIPKQIWDRERAEADECHFRLKALVKVQTQYAKLHEITYADSVEKIVQLVQFNPAFRALCDSVVTSVHEEEVAQNLKEDKPQRLYWEVPITVDSIFHCPSHGDLYRIEMDEEGNYKIFCPTESDTLIVYKFFTRIYENHGSIDHAYEFTW